METIHQILNSQVATAIGWGLLHTLWQGLVIFLVLSVLKFVFIRDEPRRNYKVYYAAMVVQLAWLIATVITNVDTQTSYPETSRLIGLSLVIASNPAESNSLWQQAFAFINSEIPTVFMLWLAGITFLSLRFMGGLLQIHFLKSRNVQEVEAELQQLFQRVSYRLGIRKAKILASLKVGMPAIVGYIKPVVLVPLGLMTHLSVEQVEALITHELIHIKRNDYLLNVIQSVMEIVLFFNPFTWWISKNIREEREKACDDLVIRYSNGLDYARALVAAKEWEMKYRLSIGVHSGKSELQTRINRIMGKINSQKSANSFKKMIASLVVLGVVAVMASFIGRDQEKQKQENPAPEAVSALPYAADEETPATTEKTASESPRLREKQNQEEEASVKTQPKLKVNAPKVTAKIELPSISLSSRIMTVKLDTPDLTFDLQKLLEEIKAHQKEWQKQMVEDAVRLKEQLSKMDLDRLTDEDRIRLREVEKIRMNEFEFSRQQMEAVQVQMAQMTEQLEKMHKTINEETQAKIQESMTKVQENMEVVEKQMKELQAKMEKCTQEIKEEALKDGYIKSKDTRVNFDWEEDGLYINHQKVKKEHEAKYAKIWKKYFPEGGRGVHFHQ